MKKFTKVLVGLLITCLGVIFALNALEITHINVFFDGWWTLFIIIPCTASLFTTTDKTGSIIGILVGVALLLSCQGVIEFKMILKLILPTIVVMIGLRIMFDDLIRKNAREVSEKMKTNTTPLRKFSAVLTNNSVDMSGQPFNGAILTASFGSLNFNLNNAFIQGDTYIKANSWFGSVNITVPEGVNVIMSSNSIFGDTGNTKTTQYSGAPVIYIKGLCVFGGINVK